MIKKKTTKIDDFEDALENLDPKLLNALKEKVRTEIEKDNNELKEELKKRRTNEKRARTQYINRMNDSDLPWFILIASPPNEGENEGLSYELDWNTAFQLFLTQQKIGGIDDLDRVENFLVEMLHNIIERKEEERLEKGESEFE